MKDCAVTTAAYLSTLLGLAAFAAYIATFTMTTYNALYFADGSNDESDVSYTLAIVECCCCGAVCIIGLLALSVPQRVSRGAVLVATLLFGTAVLLTGFCSAYRAWHLGWLGDDLERTCSDTGMTGCPTTRYEAVRDVEIRFREPSGGECSFWFWDEMPTRLQLSSVCGGRSDGLCQPSVDADIENFMDWTRARSYGWRDDPVDIASAVLNGTLATVNKVHNMKVLAAKQAFYAASAPITHAFGAQPRIAYCWYWGCSEVCQPHRFRANRWWLVSSLSMLCVYLLCGILSLVGWRRVPVPKEPREDPESASAVLVDKPVMVAPLMGRRKRRLAQTPSGLQF